MTEVRAAVPGDAQDVARVQVRACRVAYRGLIADGYLDALTPEVFARRYTFGRIGLRLPRTVVAVDGPVICGLATTGLCRDADPPNFGELIAIYVDPAYLRTGVGACSSPPPASGCAASAWREPSCGCWTAMCAPAGSTNATA